MYRKNHFYDILGVMHWLKQYQLLCLDFDGLLVSTEPLHFLAYKRMCHHRGYVLTWNFTEYCYFAHMSTKSLQEEVYRALPGLYAQEPRWAVLYEEKKRHYLDILNEKPIELLPGVEEFLCYIKQAHIPHVVVTNAFAEQVDAIKQEIPLLQQISHWITREDSPAPKPAPDPYLEALRRFQLPGHAVAGFEDSEKGIQSLIQAGITPICVSMILAPSMQQELKKQGVRCFSSFYDVMTMEL